MMVCNRSFFWAVIFIAFSSFLSTDYVYADSDNIKSQLLQQFGEYRKGVATKLRAEELRKFFSAKINGYWLDWLISDDSLSQRQEGWRAIRQRLRFGWWITNIYESNVAQKDDNTWTLTIVYDTERTGKKRTSEIDYILTDGKWLIDETLFDSTRPVENYSKKAIYQFPKIIRY